ncbi:hypothetical protein BDV12DRAFT_200580 [Aspergillus spectabilis]
MDRTRADEEIRADVDLLILDYLVCMAIYRAINVTDDNPGEWESIWLEDTTRMLRLIHPPSDMPLGLRIKTQILEIIRSFLRINQSDQAEPKTLAALASTFVSTCGSTDEMLKAHAIEVANRLCVHAARQEYRDMRNGHTEGFAENLADICKNLGRWDIGGVSPFLTRMPSAIGISVEIWLETILQIACENEDGPAAPLNTLVDIMKLLEPPILLQLERGKLKSLSRAETQKLKRKIGMN